MLNDQAQHSNCALGRARIELSCAGTFYKTLCWDPMLCRFLMGSASRQAAASMNKLCIHTCGAIAHRQKTHPCRCFVLWLS